MVYGYARVSSIGQDKYGNSKQAQTDALLAAGCEKVYYEHFTGTKMERPELTKLLEELKPGDTLKVTKLDRFARTALEGANRIKELMDRDINVHVLNIGLIENTTMGRFILRIMLSVAELERDSIMERLNEGKSIAKARDPNWREGRKAIHIEKSRFEKCRENQKSGSMTVEACCKELGISRSKWYNLCKEA